MGLVVFVVLVAWPVTELYVASLVAGQIGWGPTLLALLVLSAIGVLVLRSSGRAWRTVAASATPRAGSALPPTGTGTAAADAGFQLLAGLLLLVPGFVGAGVGLLLLLPPVRVLVIALGGRWLFRRFPHWQATMTRIRVAGHFGDVVEGEVVDGDVVDPDRPGGPPELS